MAKRVKTITQNTFVSSATPEDVYDAFMDPKKHAAFTGSPATGSARVGGRFTAWDGYITAVNRELVKGRKIVQDWQTTEWPDGAPPSKVEFTFTAARGGTEVKMVHSNVPADQADSLRQGWVDYYWEPLKDYFGKR